MTDRMETVAIGDRGKDGWSSRWAKGICCPLVCREMSQYLPTYPRLYQVNPQIDKQICWNPDFCFLFPFILLFPCEYIWGDFRQFQCPPMHRRIETCRGLIFPASEKLRHGVYLQKYKSKSSCLIFRRQTKKKWIYNIKRTQLYSIWNIINKKVGWVSKKCREDQWSTNWFGKRSLNVLNAVLMGYC